MKNIVRIICSIAFALAFSLTAKGQAGAESGYAFGVENFNRGNYQAAIDGFMMAMEEDAGDEEKAYGDSQWIAHCYYKMGNKAKAMEYDQTAYMLPPVDRRLTTESDRLSGMGRFYQKAGNIEKALDYYRRCAEKEHELLGDHWYYANSMSVMSECYFLLEQYDSAKVCIGRALDIYSRYNCTDWSLSCYNLLGNIYLSMGDLQQAEKTFRTGIALVKRGTISPDVLEMRMNLLSCKRRSGEDITKSINEIQDIVNLSSDLDNKEVYLCAKIEYAYILLARGEHQKTADEISILLNEIKAAGYEGEWIYARATTLEAVAYSNLTDPEKAYEHILKSRKYLIDHNFTDSEEFLQLNHAFLTMYVDMHPEVYTPSLNDFSSLVDAVSSCMGKENNYYLSALVSYMNHADNQTLAKEQTTKAYELMNRLPDADNQLKAHVLSEYASMKLLQGADEEETIALLDQAANFVDCHSQIWGSIISRKLELLGILLRYEEAIELGEQSISKLKSEGLDGNWVYSNILAQLSSVYALFGNATRSIELLEEALALYETTLPKDSYYYISRINYANHLAAIRRYDEAIEIVNESLHNLDPKTSAGGFFSGYNILVSIYSNLQDLQNARKYAELLERLVEDSGIGKMGGKSGELISIQRETFNVLDYAKNNDIDGAISILEESFRKLDSSQEDSYYFRLQLSYQLVSLYVLKNDVVNVQKYSVLTNEMLRNELRERFRTMTYEERANFWNMYRIWFEYTLPTFVLNHPDKTNNLTACLYDALLMGKGVLLNSEIEAKKIIENSKDKDVVKLYQAILSIKNEINKCSSVEKMAELKELLSEKEKQMMLSIGNKDDYTKFMTITWKDVRQHLDERSCAIEFVSVPVAEGKSSVYALVLKKGYEEPHYVYMFDDTDLGYTPSDAFYNSKEHGQQIWGALMQELAGCQNIYFSPAGVINNIAIENMVVGDGSLISDFFQGIYRLSSTREICRRKNADMKGKSYLFGGINYNADYSAIKEANKDLAVSKAHKQRTAFNSREHSKAVSLLPATLREIEDISRILKEDRMSSEILKGNNGTEDRLKSISGKDFSILHIATHGYFIPNNNATAARKSNKGNVNPLLAAVLTPSGTGISSQEDWMLSLSGLLFAGVNKFLAGNKLPDNQDDGILTASEISRLDLSKLDMVALSACETAKGEITGDGVFGLQRGFKKAGAKSILMSLWKVDDDATAELMKEFYTNWIQKHKSKYESLELAKKAVRSVNQWRDPKYWAAFILLDGM